jgi:hypothetical protein
MVGVAVLLYRAKDYRGHSNAQGSLNQWGINACWALLCSRALISAATPWQKESKVKIKHYWGD